MNNILILFLLIFILQFDSIQLCSQEESKKSRKNSITFNVTRLILLEARFGYERQLSDRHVIRASLGIQFPIKSESFSYRFYVPFYYPVSKGAYIGLGYNYYVNKRSHLYISSEIYFNYSYYDNKYYEHCVGSTSNSYITLQSMILQKTGIKFLIGKTMIDTSRKKNRIQLDIFGGIGIQYRAEEITTYQKKQGECSIAGYYEFRIYDPPLQETSIGWRPTLHGGILLSFPF